jgi:hypothetical protein
LKSKLPIFSFFLVVLIAVFSCDPFGEEISDDPSLELIISLDTLKFDTVITSVSSINRGFRVFNPHSKAVKIDRLFLGLGEASAYDLIVQGRHGKSFDDLVVFGGDSLLVIAEVLIDPMDQDLPFLVKDSIVLNYNTNDDHVKLVAWGQDANFIDNRVICDEIWDSPKPYVVYNRAIVDTACTLTIREGVRIYLDNTAEFTIGGTLVVQGSADNKVVFRNSRLDPDFEIAPGQWSTLFFLPGSTGNLIDHAIMRNGVVGITLGLDSEGNNAELTLTNTSIGHMSQAGIFALNANLSATNLEIFNCGGFLMANVAGGSYDFNHCTFSNERSLFIRNEPSVIFSNLYDNGVGTVIIGDMNAELRNSIVWGGQDEELLLSEVEGSDFSVNVTQNIIASGNSDFESDNLISREVNFPGFRSTFAFDFQLDSLSNARNMAIDSDLTTDLLGTVRDSLPDLGAYERLDSIR